MWSKIVTTKGPINRKHGWEKLQCFSCLVSP